jgi:hypothetical protein
VTPEQLAACERLLAELGTSEEAGRRTFAAWLARGVEEHGTACDRYSTDGTSICADFECIATRVPGIRLVPETRPALLSDQRYRAGTTNIRLQHAIADELVRTGTPFVRVRPVYSRFVLGPDDLVRGLHAADELAMMVAEGAFSLMAEALVSAWLENRQTCEHRGFREVATCFRSVFASGECVLTWANTPAGIGTLSGRKYVQRTHHALVRDEVRSVLQHRRIPFRELRPLPGARPPTMRNDLLASWHSSGLSVVTAAGVASR